MIKAYLIVVLILMDFIIIGSCEENNEESRLGTEYTQIFHYQPTLFEYFLDVLQQRVQVLEKDDITTFLESPDTFHNDECTNNEVKREADQCLAINETPLNDEKTIDEITDNNVKSYQGGNKYKRQNRRDAKGKAYTTKIYEYGLDSNQYLQAYKKNIDDFTRREIIKRELIDKPLSKHFADIDKHERSIINKKIKGGRSKRNDPKLGKDIAGIDWSLFYLSPEEVEEKAIKTDQMIDNYKNKS